MREIRQIRLIRRIGLIGLILLAAAAAGSAQTLTVLQSSFTGGELSPLAAARLDAPRYAQSVATMTNMVALPQGPAVRRPGTIYAGATDSNRLARLIPFRYSSTDAYALEFTDHTMRLWRSHGLVTDANGIAYHLTTPFSAAELANLQMWQSADTCYLVAASDWPQKLVRVDHNDWSIADAPFDDGPFLSENLSATTIAADATTGDANLVATTPLFNALHVGSYWRLRDLVAMQRVSGTLTGVDTNSTDLACQADQNFQWEVHGTFSGTVELQLSYDSGATWAAYALLSSTSSAATTETVYTNDTGQDIELRVRCTEYTSGTISYQLWTHAYMHTGVVRVTDYNDPCNVTATVIRTLASTDPTVYWSEGAWSPYRGYPRAIAMYNERLVLAGTTHQPLTMWFSASGDYESFDPAVGDDADSFAYTLGRSEQDPLVWIVSDRQRGLLAGTAGAILELAPLDATQGIMPANPPAVTSTLAIPCAAVPPILADNVRIALQRGGRKVRELLYDYSSDSLVGPDLTLFAEHVTAGGITAWAWQTQPYTILWSVRADGTLLALTYDRSYQIVGWATHTLGGSGAVESVCVLPGATEDELWLVVRRTIGAATKRYVEYLAPWDWGTDQHDVHFLDSGLVYDSTPATTLTGLGHLAGLSAGICADGAAVAAQTVTAGGAVALPYAASVVHVGLPYTSTLATLRYDVTGAQGTTWARRKTLSKATVSFYQTLGPGVGRDASHLFVPDYRAAGAVQYAGAPPLFSGDEEIAVPGAGFGLDAAQLLIRQTQPLPLTVRAIIAEVQVK